MPFTDSAQAYRDGLMLQFQYNQNATKKSQIKYYDDLLPYLKRDQSWFEDERVAKVKKTLEQVSSMGGVALPDILGKVQKAIEEEKAKATPDTYLIKRLSQLHREYATNQAP